MRYKFSSRPSVQLCFWVCDRWHLIWVSQISTPVALSFLRILNKWGLIHRANHILISADRPRRCSVVPHSACLGDNSWGSSMPTRRFPLGCWVITRNLVIVWEGVKGSRLHLPAGGIAGEKKKKKKNGGKWRTEQIEMKGILFHFDCQQRGDSFFSFSLPLSTASARGLWGESCCWSFLWSI